MHATTLREAVEQYILFHDLSCETAAWYRRVGSVFAGWAGRDVLLDDFNGEQISRLLLAKRDAGRSAHYVKSLRNGLVALLREIRGDAPIERVRSIRTDPLDPQAWTPQEVERLLEACEAMPAASRWRWRLTIAVAYYTGLDRCDLWRLERQHISPDGLIRFRRQKTKSPVCVALPPEVVLAIDAHCPAAGPILHLQITPEWFRAVFAGIVRRAGLVGTFKKFRKTSGSLVERDNPGRGHKHLGNTRAIFERHYEVREITRADAAMPPKIRFVG
jgi:integrase